MYNIACKLAVGQHILSKISQGFCCFCFLFAVSVVLFFDYLFQYFSCRQFCFRAKLTQNKRWWLKLKFHKTKNWRTFLANENWSLSQMRKRTTNVNELFLSFNQTSRIKHFLHWKNQSIILILSVHYLKTGNASNGACLKC